MLDDGQKAALRRWYSQPEIVDKAKQLSREERWEELEEHINMLSLTPLSKIDQLPDYMVKQGGEPLIPSNVNPHKDIEEWRDAVEVGWEVMEGEIGISQDSLNQKIAARQRDNWDEFIKSVERRKKERERR